LTVPVTRGDLVIQVVERGEIDSQNAIEVRCEIEGYQNKLVSIVPEGTFVKKGEVVAQFDMEAMQKLLNEQEIKWKQAEGKAKAAKAELELQLNKQESEVAKAELAMQTAILELEKYEKAEMQADLNEKRGALELAKKDLAEAQAALELTKRLVSRGFAQLDQLRFKEMEVEQKSYLVNRDELRLKVLDYDARKKMTELKFKEKDARLEWERAKKSAQAAVEKARSELLAAEETAKLEQQQLERLKSRMDRYLVKAPQDGIVVYFKRPWDESQRIGPGATLYYQQPIFTLPDLTRLKVKVRVHESMVKKVKPEQKATIQIDALPHQVLHGTVKLVATLADSNWRSSVKEYLTDIFIDDLPLEAGLKPGMTGEVTIHIDTLRDVLMAPIQAVTEWDGKHVVYVGQGGRFERREVRIGESNEQFVQILSGVDAGELVALDARSRSAAEAKKRADEKTKESSEATDSRSPPLVRE
jgi:RND family efflux transporter MFP subunit